LNKIGRTLRLNIIERKGTELFLNCGGLLVSGKVRCISKGENKAYYGPEVHDNDFSFLLPNTHSTITHYIVEARSIIL